MKQTSHRPEESISKTHNQQRICIQDVLTKQNNSYTPIKKGQFNKGTQIYKQKIHRNRNVSAQETYEKGLNQK